MVPRSLAALLMLASVLGARQASRVHFVRASGEATITVKPDRAQITIGVSTSAPTAETASAQNATGSSRVLKAIHQVLGAGGQVNTSGYSISPRYDYSNGHAPRLTGYDASNTVLVTVDDLPLVSKIIDASSSAGANNINGISFTLRDESAVRAQALAEAAINARANAESIAKALNVRVVGMLEAEPTEAPVVRPLPMAKFASAARETAATPVEAGNLDIHAAVTVTLEVQ